MKPDQTAPIGAVCLEFVLFASMKKILSEKHLKICSRHKKQNKFSGQKNSGGVGVKRRSTSQIGGKKLIK